jgi:S-adenosylmethionine:tRNA-ribosyltransferase-isomerase (queuine synthetase)
MKPFLTIFRNTSSGRYAGINNTKVIPARNKFNKSTGAQIEVFCLDDLIPADYAKLFKRKPAPVNALLESEKMESGELEKDADDRQYNRNIKSTTVATLQSNQQIRLQGTKRISALKDY